MAADGDALCGAAEFAALVEEMVNDEAPRLFAVVQELGDRVDGRIAAWGLSFEGRAEVVGWGGGRWLSVRSPERASWLLGRAPGVTTRLVWVSGG